VTTDCRRVYRSSL